MARSLAGPRAVAKEVGRCPPVQPTPHAQSGLDPSGAGAMWPGGVTSRVRYGGHQPRSSQPATVRDPRPGHDRGLRPAAAALADPSTPSTLTSEFTACAGPTGTAMLFHPVKQPSGAAALHLTGAPASSSQSMRLTSKPERCSSPPPGFEQNDLTTITCSVVNAANSREQLVTGSWCLCCRRRCGMSISRAYPRRHLGSRVTHRQLSELERKRPAVTARRFYIPSVVRLSATPRSAPSGRGEALRLLRRTG
jgi:hypothetical protein